MYIHVHVCVGALCTSWYVDEGEEGGRREGERRRVGGEGKRRMLGEGKLEREEMKLWGGDEKQHYSSSIPGSQGQIMATQQFDDN